jgi:hypothetical protein
MEVKVEISRLLKKVSFKGFESVSFKGCPLIHAEALARYLSISKIQDSLKELAISFLPLNENVL